MKRVLNKQPLVSIAMATYNGEKFLRYQMDSILNQTYTNIEIIICDDCSTDNTLLILDEYKEKYKNINLIKNDKNLGYIKNFEKAISYCNGEFIALSDQDDVWMKDKIKILLEEIEHNLLIHSDATLIDKNGNQIAASYTKKSKQNFLKYTSCLDYYYGNVVTGCTCFFNKELLKEFTSFPPMIHHDWWLALNASARKKIKYLDKCLIQYRQHENNVIGVILSDNHENENNKSIKNEKRDLFKKRKFDYDSRDKMNKIYFSFFQEVLSFNIILIDNYDISPSSSLYKYHKRMKKMNERIIDYYNSYYERKIRVRAFFIYIRYYGYFNTIGKGNLLSLFNSLIGNPQATR